MKLSTLPTLPVTAVLAAGFLMLGCKVKSTVVGQENQSTIQTPVVSAPVVAPAAVVPAPGTDAPVLTTVAEGAGGEGPAAPTNVVPANVTLTNLVELAAATNTYAHRVAAGQVQLAEPIRKLIELAEGGVGDEVLLAYIEGLATPPLVSADEILYLTDLGISENVITALIKRGGAVASQSATNAPVITEVPAQATVPQGGVPATSGEPSVSIAATPQFEAAPEAAVAPQQPVVVQQPVYVQQPVVVPQVEYQYFYHSLSPYGSWVDVPGYGVCWRPTVASVDPGWQPYSHRGRWVYTDYGWYWHSDYSWGWAPFHYGRWHRHSRHGWMWHPDHHWGPAWVTWRYTDGYCGWAPLPPGVRYYDRHGLRYHSASVGISFDFGLSHDCYTFIPTRHFHDRHPWRHRLDRHHVRGIYNKTKIVNNYQVGRDRTPINEGVGRGHIERETRSEIRKVAIRDVPTDRVPPSRADRLVRNGKELVVYRPKLPDPDIVTSRDRQEVRNGTIPSINASRPAAAGTVGPRSPGAVTSPSGNPVSGFVPSGNVPSRENAEVRKSSTPDAAAPVAVIPSRNPQGNQDSSPVIRGEGRGGRGNVVSIPSSVPSAHTVTKSAEEPRQTRAISSIPSANPGLVTPLNSGRLAANPAVIPSAPVTTRGIPQRELPKPIAEFESRAAEARSTPSPVNRSSVPSTVNPSVPQVNNPAVSPRVYNHLPMANQPSPSSRNQGYAQPGANVQVNPRAINLQPQTQPQRPVQVYGRDGSAGTLNTPVPSRSITPQANPSVSSRYELAKPQTTIHPDKRTYTQPSNPQLQSLPSVSPSRSIPSQSPQPSFPSPSRSITPSPSQSISSTPRSASPAPVQIDSSRVSRSDRSSAVSTPQAAGPRPSPSAPTRSRGEVTR